MDETKATVPSNDEESEDENDEPQPIVVDGGSCTFRIGLAAEQKPRHTFPSVVACKTPATPTTPPEYYIGQEAWDNRTDLQLQNPMQLGSVVDWGCLEQMWHHAFHKVLQVDPKDRRVLLTESSQQRYANKAHREHRERITQMMFETFQVSGLYMQNCSTLCLYASGRTTGLVLSSGCSCTYVLPVYEGHALPHARARVPYGGCNVTLELCELLLQSSPVFSSFYQTSSRTQSNDVLVDIKEQYCFVQSLENVGDTRRPFEASGVRLALLSGRHQRLGANSTIKTMPTHLLHRVMSFLTFKKGYALPNGTQLHLGDELYRATEKMFLKTEVHFPGLLHQCTMKCDIDLRKDLLKNIIVCGRNTCFPGFQERMKEQIQTVYKVKETYQSKSDVVKVIGRSDISAWCGGSILASLRTMEREWITREDYEKYGPSIVNRKCF
jgi:actin-related protein